jgi:hypothetical protein
MKTGIAGVRGIDETNVRSHEVKRSLEDRHPGLRKGEMEPTLRESEKRYRALFDLGPMALYCCNASASLLSEGWLMVFNELEYEPISN